MTNITKLNERELPLRASFYSLLNEEGISDEDCQHAKRVWSEFGMSTTREYHDLYLRCDVLQLSDMFKTFRDKMLEYYQLDPCHYYTAPGMAWDAMLKMTGVSLELINDQTMYEFVGMGKRGGVSTITKRYAKANSPYMKHGYDPKKKISYIMYVDANNLCGWAMSQPLPVGNFRWMSKAQLEQPIDKLPPCFVEVDLSYPPELHDKFADYVPAPDNIIPEGSKVSKLAPNLLRKDHYVCHVKNLQLYAKLGVVVEKVHRWVSLKECTFLAPYIRRNTDLRIQTKNKFEKDFFKLLNNSVVGKSCKNLLNRVDVRLVSEKKKALRLVAKPTYKHHTIYDENLLGVHMRVSKVKLNKPSYFGVAVLDLSKTLMYEFHYNYIKPKYGDNARLLFMDTDSLCYHIKIEDLYKYIADDVPKWFDTSDYPEDHPSRILTGVNKKVIVTFKDKACGELIIGFSGVRAKCYALKFQDKEKKKCKVVKSGVVKKVITYEDYENCVLRHKSS